jgi:hypothetical protein
MSRVTHPRSDGSTCIKCRRKFERGDRVQVVNIIEKVGTNPSNPREVGSWFSGEFEVAHINCADTALESTIIIGSGT